MEFRFNEDQIELRSQARRFLAAESTHSAVDAAMKTERGYDEALWSRVTEDLGWQALVIPEAYDGIGMTFGDLHPLMEEMGRHAFCSPFFSTVALGTSALLVAGSVEQKSAYLPGIAAGEVRATLAYRGRGVNAAAEGADAVTVVARREGEGFVLDGECGFVVDGHTADRIVVAARDEGSTSRDGVGLFVVAGDAQGLTRKLTPTMDQTRKLASLRFDGVRVDASAKLDRGNAETLGQALDLAMIAQSAEMVGAAEACLDMAVEYAKVRKQFGRPIGSFQAIKHKCADMLMRVESARSVAFYASQVASAALTEAGLDPERTRELAEAASSAKAYCSDALYLCAGENIQIHGGIGFTWEHIAHIFFKRAQSSSTLLGSARHHRERVAALIGL